MFSRGSLKLLFLCLIERVWQLRDGDGGAKALFCREWLICNLWRGNPFRDDFPIIGIVEKLSIINNVNMGVCFIGGRGIKDLGAFLRSGWGWEICV